jgi:hypothetical protein
LSSVFIGCSIKKVYFLFLTKLNAMFDINAIAC